MKRGLLSIPVLMAVLLSAGAVMADIAAVIPAQNALDVSETTYLQAVFTEEMNAATINNSTFIVKSRLAGEMAGNVVYVEGLTSALFLPSEDFKAGDQITAMLTDGIETSGGQPLIGGYIWAFTITSCAYAQFNGGHAITGDNPSFVTVGDYNSDSHIDMATCSQINSTLSIIMNDGADNFPMHNDLSLAPSAGPTRIYSADFDADGDLDLVTANNGDGTFTVYLNDGSGGFPSNDWVTRAYPYIYDCTPADIDGDGFIDILASKSNPDAAPDTATVFYNNGDASFGASINFEVLRQPYRTYAADLNNDGRNDLIIVHDYSSVISIIYNNGGGLFGGRIDYAVSGGAKDITIADFNGNGYQDIAVASYIDDVILMLNDQPGQFTVQTPIATVGHPEKIISADWDSDGDIDLALTIEVSSNNMVKLYNNGDATFGPQQASGFGSAYSGLFAADYNSDGSVDIAMTSRYYDKVYLIKNLGIPSAPELIQPEADRKFLEPATVDFECDSVVTALYYLFQVASDSAFAQVIGNSGYLYGETSWTPPYEFDEGVYYWRVSAINNCGIGKPSAVRSFSVHQLCNLDWQPMNSGVNRNLFDVWGSSNSNVFAVGQVGRILRFNGTSWDTMTTVVNDDLKAIWGLSGSNVYTVGNNNTILHYGGSSWSIVEYGGYNSYQDIWGSSANDIYVVGTSFGSSDTPGLVYHYDGLGWSEVELGGINTSYVLFFRVWGSAANDVYVSGIDYMTSSSLIIHYDGENWSAVTDPDVGGWYFKDIWGSSADNIYAAGYDINFSGANILHYNGSDWSPVFTGFSGSLNGIWGSSADDIYAVSGVDLVGHVIHFDGQTWSEMSTICYNNLTGIYGVSGTNVFVVGLAGEIQNYFEPAAPVLYSPLNGKTLQEPVSPHLNCNDVYGASAYYFEIDDDSAFGSPIATDPSGVSVSEWDVPAALGVGVYYWRARAANQCGYGDWSEVWHIVVEGLIPSCPVLYSYDGQGFVQENPLLTACELSGYNDVVTDYYHVTGTVAPRDGKIVFQLREMEDEITYLEEFELITVDHRETSLIGCTVDGNIFAYENSVAPISVVDRNGIDRTETVAADDNDLFIAEGSGSLVITFPNLGARSSLSFSSAKKLPCIENPPTPKTTAGDIPNALIVEQLTDDGTWVKLSDIPFRTNPNAEFVMGNDLMSMASETITVRISWTGAFATDEIRQYVPSEEIPIVQTWPAIDLAVNSEKVPAKSWPGFGGEPLALTKGESIEPAFTVESPKESGTVRDYIVRATGRYQPDYRVYSNLIPGKYQLYNNYPNPFNPATTIRYDLPKAGAVRLEIYNILGQQVTVLVDGMQNAGHYEVLWDGRNNAGAAVSSGVYFYKLSAEGFTDSKKMTLVK